VLRSPGQPLDAQTRSQMEPSFGHSFGDVRVHADARAAESARAVGAVACTTGRHILFGAGRYAPASPAGRSLLAHELAHVVQQRGAPAGAEPEMVDLNPSSPWEQEASRAAVQSTASRRAGVTRAASGRMLQRQKKVEEPAAGCGVCHGGAAVAGTLAHKLIQIEEFLPALGAGGLAELPVGCVSAPRRPPRPDLIILRGNTWLIGSIKPARQVYYNEGRSVFQFYSDCIRRFALSKGTTATVLPLRIPIPLSGMPYPNWQVKNPERCIQEFFLNAPDAYGTYGYYCNPPRSRLKFRPECACEPRRRKKKQKQKRGRGRKAAEREAKREARREASRDARRAGRATEKAVSSELRKKGVKKAARKVATKAVGKVVAKTAAKFALKFVPVVGWVLLAVDIAEAAHGIYLIAKYGVGSGGGEGEPGPGGPDKEGAGRAREGKEAKRAAEGEGEREGEGEGERAGEAEASEEGGEPWDVDLTEEEMKRLGIFKSEEEAEEYANSLPLSKELLKALKESTPAQQELLRLTLARTGEGKLAVTEEFFLKLLTTTSGLTEDELAGLVEHLSPAAGETLDEALARLDKALKSIRAKESAKEAGPEGGEKEGKAETEAEGAGAAPAKGAGPAGAGKGKTGAGTGAAAAESAKRAPAGPAILKEASDAASKPPAGVDRKVAAAFSYLILSGLSASGSYKEGAAYACKIRITELTATPRKFELSGVKITYLGRTDNEETADGRTYVQTTFKLQFAEDFWSERNKFLGLGGAGTAGNYDFGRRLKK